MKKLCFLIVLFFSITTGFAQSFMHGAGLSIFVATASGGSSAVNGGFTYSPRFNFVEQDNLSVSVGIPLSVGLSGSYSSRYNSNSGSSTSNTLSVMADAPLVINLNMGCGSTKENESRFGYFIGGGFGYHYGTYNLSDVLNGESVSTKFSATGPVGNAGIRFGVGRGSHNIEVRFQYMKGLSDTKPNIFGVGSLFNF
jgi:hypothetical protein